MKSSDWTARSAMTCENKIENTLRVDGTCETNLLVSPGVSHDPHCLHRQEHGERLADFLVESRLADLGDVDVICLLQDLHLLARHRAQDPDREPRTWERVPLHERCGDVEQPAQRAHLVCTHTQSVEGRCGG